MSNEEKVVVQLVLQRQKDGAIRLKPQNAYDEESLTRCMQGLSLESSGGLDRSLFTRTRKKPNGFDPDYSVVDGIEYHRFHIGHRQLFEKQGEEYVRKGTFNTEVTPAARKAAKAENRPGLRDTGHIMPGMLGVQGSPTNTESQCRRENRSVQKKFESEVTKAFKEAGPTSSLYMQRKKYKDGSRVLNAEIVRGSRTLFQKELKLGSENGSSSSQLFFTF